MRYHALACDYDGTIARQGIVDPKTIAALEQVRESGRKLLLVTGRQLDDLAEVFPRFDLFDRIVAENGALLYRPASHEEKCLVEPPPKEFGEQLSKRGVEYLSFGRVIVATRQPYEVAALDVIRDLGLEMQVIFNKGSVMILPSGVNKAVGLTHALTELQLSPHNVVGVGDAENDHAFLSLCECGIAVADALDMLKQRADWVTRERDGEGVQELIRLLIESDLAFLEGRLHHKLIFGKNEAGGDLEVNPYRTNILVTGTSGGGKSMLATAMVESLFEHGYQFLIIDPEGDFAAIERAVVLGDNRRPPAIQEVMDILAKVDQCGIVNLAGFERNDRTKFFEVLLPRIQESRAKTGRPHWIIVNEAHQVVPSSWKASSHAISQHGVMLITLEPDRLSKEVLSSIDIVFAVGEEPAKMLDAFARSVGASPPLLQERPLNRGEAYAWFRRTANPPVWFRTAVSKETKRVSL